MTAVRKPEKWAKTKDAAGILLMIVMALLSGVVMYYYIGITFSMP